MTIRRLPMLWRPAKASVLFSDHVTKSARQPLSWPAIVDMRAVDVDLNQSRVIASRAHFAISGLVFVSNWLSVFAVITTRVSSQVSSPHFTSIAINADLPIPCPEATAIRNGVKRVAGLLKWSPIMSKVSPCHARGPLASTSSPSPHGKAKIA